jgi:hypothetical protein
MFNLHNVLNALAFVFTIFLILYGLVRGFDLTELIINVLYLITMVIVLGMDLFNKAEKGI